MVKKSLSQPEPNKSSMIPEKYLTTTFVEGLFAYMGIASTFVGITLMTQYFNNVKMLIKVYKTLGILPVNAFVCVLMIFFCIVLQQIFISS